MSELTAQNLHAKMECPYLDTEFCSNNGQLLMSVERLSGPDAF